MSEPVNTADGAVPEDAAMDQEQPRCGAGETAALRSLVVFSVLYVLLSWGAGSLYGDGHELLAGLVGVTAALAGIVAVINLVWLVAPGSRSHAGRLAKAVAYLACALVILGVPALASYLAH